MPRLLESIRVKDGVFHHLPYHQQRMHRAQQALFGEVTMAHLANHLSVPEHAQRGLYKCRIVYQEAIESVEFIAYHPKTIRTLRCVSGNNVKYDHKYEDRKALNELFAQRGNCDDVLIVRDGWVTDTSYANIMFYDGRRWVTPHQPLLRGTQRQYLLDQGVITEGPVREADIGSFQTFRLINALLGIGHPAQPVHNVI